MSAVRDLVQEAFASDRGRIDVKKLLADIGRAASFDTVEPDRQPLRKRTDEEARLVGQ